jgi:hypothetical protein
LTGDEEIPAFLRDQTYFDLRGGNAKGVAGDIVAAIRNNIAINVLEFGSLSEPE